MLKRLANGAQGAFWGFLDGVWPGGAEQIEATARTHIHCLMNPAESAEVTALISAHPRVASQVALIFSESHEEVGSVIMTPAYARAFAAGVLNAADEADGTTPILFMPPGPEGVEP